MTPRQPSQALARPLPMPVRPYEDETTRSYIRRINTANALHHGDLMKALRRARRPWIDSLSVWMETPPDTLMLAMPQLGKHRSEPAFRQKLVGRPIRTTHSPACHRCTLTRGAGPYIEIYTTHERVICPAHGLWIGEGIAGFTDQFTVRACPEITTAWHHHKNLITRHGHSQVRRAFHIASVINWSWYDQFQHFTAAMDIYDTLAGDHPRQANSKALVAAALYPSIVTLTAVIASPYWLANARSSRPDVFLERVSHEITDGWQPQGAFDPLRHWMETNWPPGFRGSDTILPRKTQRLTPITK